MNVTTLQVRTALNATGGFLQDASGGGYTHTFNPAVGCAYAGGFCGAFCYARGFAERLAGAGTWGRDLLVKENAPEILERELGVAARRDRDHPHHLDRLRVFSSSTTDPCAGAVREVYRRCLHVLDRQRPARWVLQTRSPGVLGLEEEIRRLGDFLVISFTLETDDEELWTAASPGSPGIAARMRAVERLATWDIRLHLAVSPLLPLRDPESFADWIAGHADDATVDTFVSGDGSGGSRTSRSSVTTLLAARGHDWRSEKEARAFHGTLAERMGGRVGWSAEGFLRLAT